MSTGLAFQCQNSLADAKKLEYNNGILQERDGGYENKAYIYG
jgi:hypothetical protein